MNSELINILMPYILSALGAILAYVGAYLGVKVKDLLDTKQKRFIVEQTVKYVEQVGKALGSDEKLALAKQKSIEWINTKGLSVSEIELDILIEAFVNDFFAHYYPEKEEELESVGSE